MHDLNFEVLMSRAQETFNKNYLDLRPTYSTDKFNNSLGYI